MKYSFLTDLERHLIAKYPKLGEDFAIESERCPEGMTGDLTVNCFRFAKACGNPMALAIEVTDYLKAHPAVADAQPIKAFVNVTVKPAALFADTVADMPRLLKSAKLPNVARERILIEFSAPNTNKPQHLGHVRNNTLGMSLASLLKRVGHDVIEINLVNDRGIHICKSMMAYLLAGDGCTPESTGIKGDHLVGKFYVEYNKMLGAELKQLRVKRPELADKSDEDLFLESDLGAKTQKMLQDWEAGNPEVIALWKRMNGWVFAGFDQTYKRIGITFDHTYLESNTYLLGKDIVADGLARGVFFKRPDGAVCVDLGKLGNKVVLRSDGTSVYITQDIGTTLLKYNDYHPGSMIWVVGDEQNLHFQMLFEIMKKLGYPWADNLYHLSYGMVNLPTGKMKSREGTVVDADDLFDEMSTLAYEACKERAADGSVDEADLRRRGEIIGLGALKFMLLKFNPKTTIMFDPAASIRFEGDTGPYVQYAAARIQSIMRKGLERGIRSENADWSLLGRDEEKALAVLAGAYPEKLQYAAGRRDCSSLAEYLLDLAKAFNRFYRECPVLAAENEGLIRARLALADAVRLILVDGLQTLTIQTPEAM